MILSYTACFAAVTLRIWLSLLGWYFQAFISAHSIEAWLSLVPNLIAAYWFVSRKDLMKQVIE